MSFQGHIENGGVVLDEPVLLPNGTVVRIEPVEPVPLCADTDLPNTMQQMALSWKSVSQPARAEEVAISIDPDDYPLF